MTAEERAEKLLEEFDVDREYFVAHECEAAITQAIKGAVEEALEEDARNITEDEKKSLAEYTEMLKSVKDILVADAVAEENEACAKVAEEYYPDNKPPGMQFTMARGTCFTIAQAIRNRKPMDNQCEVPKGP